MQLRIERTAAHRMTDMYVLRFPGPSTRFLSFTVRDWQSLCPDVTLARGQAVDIEMQLLQIPTNPFEALLTNR